MPLKIFDKEALIEKRIKEAHTTHAVIFAGSGEENRTSNMPVKLYEKLVQMGSNHWDKSKSKFELWNGKDGIAELQKKLIAQTQDAAQAPSDDVLTALLGKIFLDITRRIQESPDLTSLIATEVTDFEFGETVNLREIYKYIGEFQVIKGTNDSVPLIEQTLGETDSVDMVLRGLGWKTSLKNLLFNKLHTMEKVLQAVADAYTDMRNARVIGPIIDATFVASQKQGVDTVGTTYDVKMYNTFRKAVKKIRGLKDYRTDRPIAVPSLSILCNSYDTWSIARSIQGQLQGPGGVLSALNMQALPINQIIEYDQGITNGRTWGKKTLSFEGVTAGTAYLFVPREYFWVLNKRPLTMETGRGSVLQLSQEERAWYNVQTEFYKIFLGSSYDGTALGASFGAIVQVTLPTDS
jgi:hypothetical protein